MMDRRIKRSRRLMGEALIRLLQERSLHAITIRDITEQADVAYSTFFRNFHDKDELLLAYMRDFLQDIRTDASVTEAATYRDACRRGVLTGFYRLQNEQEMCRVLFQSAAAQPILQNFKREITQGDIEMAKRMLVRLLPDAPPLEIVLAGATSHYFGLIEWWIDNDFSHSPEAMTDYWEQMVLQSTWRTLLGEEGMRALLYDANSEGQR